MGSISPKRGLQRGSGTGTSRAVDSKLSSTNQQVVVRSSSSSSRMDSGDPSRLELDVERVGVSSEMVELRGKPYRFWAQ